MSSSRPSPDASQAANRLSNPANASTSTVQPTTSSASPAPSSWVEFNAASPSPGVAQNGVPSTAFPQFSATTAEILNRIRANGPATGTPAFEAKRAEVLQSYVTSDKLPTPPPIAGAGRRGRGGRTHTPSQLKTEIGASPGSGTSGRGSGRGRGRGRGGRGGRGGKRKRSESFDSEDDDSDISTSYTPQQTRTKSGRNVNRPVSFVPTIPEPSQTVKRRRSTKTILTAQCKICHRGTDPTNNRIVFCDMCSTAYHQYCHDPPINNDVVTVLEKEWLCGPCERSKQSVIEGTEGLTSAEGLPIEEKRAYLSTLPQRQLVSLLLHAVIRHPELPIFPHNVEDLIPDQPSTIPKQPPPVKPRTMPWLQAGPSQSMASPNGLASADHTPRSQHPTTDSSDMDPAEAQLLGEISHSRTHDPRTSPVKGTGTSLLPEEAMGNEYEDGYDTDPPAHFPKAGNGLARTLRPESEDLQWLVDDNFEVFSHGWKGDGSGMGADGVLDGMGKR